MVEFHLVAIVRNYNRFTILRLPLSPSLEQRLKESWTEEYELFTDDLNQIDYRIGPKLLEKQCFRLQGFNLPIWIGNYDSTNAASIVEIDRKKGIYESIQGTVVFTRNKQGEEILLFQDFAQSNIISPDRYLQFEGNSYRNSENYGLLLDRQLSAVHVPKLGLLLFRNYRAVNSFLPISSFIQNASMHEVTELLQHDRLATEDIDRWVNGADSWFRKRFLMLKESGILDRYSAEEIKFRSIGFDVSIHLKEGKIVFPSDYRSAKKLLQFLNEDLYRGVFTGTVYDAKSKVAIKLRR